ncbi:MAG: hypothetical protein J07AB43_00130 [Candidatus Nanosalina sp. J07AB43]|nr:MAG: hypothetical protein J07AB43_00130 [Candidatus Nanosalina sp. J07AB43]
MPVPTPATRREGEPASRTGDSDCQQDSRSVQCALCELCVGCGCAL